MRPVHDENRAGTLVVTAIPKGKLVPVHKRLDFTRGWRDERSRSAPLDFVADSSVRFVRRPKMNRCDILRLYSPLAAGGGQHTFLRTHVSHISVGPTVGAHRDCDPIRPSACCTLRLPCEPFPPCPRGDCQCSTIPLPKCPLSRFAGP